MAADGEAVVRHRPRTGWKTTQIFPQGRRIFPERSRIFPQGGQICAQGVRKNLDGVRIRADGARLETPDDGAIAAGISLLAERMAKNICAEIKKGRPG